MAEPYLLNEQENIAANDFFKNHRCGDSDTRPMLRMNMFVTPTHVGYNITVECGRCGKRENITDHGSF